MTFDFSPFVTLKVGDLVQILETYKSIAGTIPVETIINSAPPGAITEQTAELLRYIWDNPSLIEAGIAETQAALSQYGADTLISEIPELVGATGGSGGVNVVVETNGLGVATYTLPFSQIKITVNGDTATITGAGIDDTVPLEGLDRIKVADGTVAFDADGAAGKLFGLYEAGFNRAPDAAGFKFWLDFLDPKAAQSQDALNQAIAQAADDFVTSSEFQGLYGGILNDADAFVTALYRNILDRDPDAAGLKFWADLYRADTIDASGALEGLSISGENLATVKAEFSDGFFF